MKASLGHEAKLLRSWPHSPSSLCAHLCASVSSQVKQNEAKCGGTSFGLLMSYVCIGKVEGGSEGREGERERLPSQNSAIDFMI